jgi:hypothetical protein
MHHRLVRRAIVVALVLTTGVASAAHLRSLDTLPLTVDFVTKYHDEACAGTPTAHHCVPTTGSAVIRGLGRVDESYMYTVFAPPGEKCAAGVAWPFLTAGHVLTVAGKGEIHLALSNAGVVDSTGCTSPSGANTYSLSFTVVGGTGVFAGATGSGTLAKTWGVNLPPTGRDSFTGTLTAPGFTFDLVAPTISGAKSRTVVAPKGKKRVRVVMRVVANDAVDGPVVTSCTPRSGSVLPLGRTRVACIATDSSANTARAQFTISVKRAR